MPYGDLCIFAKISIMHRSLPLFLFALILVACNSRPEPIADSRKNDFALYDEQGDLHRLSYYNDSKAIVLFIQGNGCPIVRSLLTDFHAIVSDYSESGITFFMLNSNIQDDRVKIRKEALEFGFEVPVLDDSAQFVADELDLNITAEALVLHPTNREVLYRGPINDRLDYEAQKNEPQNRFLRDALDAILEGKTPRNKEEVTRGCTVTRLSKTLEQNETLTYNEDIAPILAESCVRCHRPEGVAPWAMTDYETVKGWSAMMKEVLISKRMPPWRADPQIGHFSNSFALEDSNARKILRWINGSLARGDGPDYLKNVDIRDDPWTHGTPDKVIVLEKEKIPATGTIDFRYQEFQLNVAGGVWLRGVGIKPGNPGVVHHALVNGPWRREKTSSIVNRRQYADNFIALVDNSGYHGTFYPEGTGVFVPEGATLKVQIHYTPTGRAEEDQTEIGLYYHAEPPEKEFYSLTTSNLDFVIPPFAKNVKHIARDTIQKDIYIHQIVPHMHYRGKNMKFSVVHPDGTVKPLVSVPDYSFNWQWMYELSEPEFVPKGSVIEVIGIHDNSYQNPLNPDPEKEIRYGLQSSDEMLMGFFYYTLADSPE